VINHEENTIVCSPEYNNKEKEKEETELAEEEDPEESHNPQPRELVFEFSDSFLQNRVCSDINPCSKKDRGLKIHWKKMTPELFQEIYIWEKKQLALQNKVKQYQIQTKFNVNRSTYYRWKKKNTNARSLLDPPIIITKKINPCKSIKPNFNGKEMGSFH